MRYRVLKTCGNLGIKYFPGEEIEDFVFTEEQQIVSLKRMGCIEEIIDEPGKITAREMEERIAPLNAKDEELQGKLLDIQSQIENTTSTLRHNQQALSKVKSEGRSSTSLEALIHRQEEALKLFQEQQAAIQAELREVSTQRASIKAQAI